MKATIDIPDDLYRLVKAKSALSGQPVREVVIGLFQDWIAEEEMLPEPAPSHAGEPPPAWFGVARKYAEKVRHHDMASIRQSVAHGRAQKVPSRKETP